MLSMEEALDLILGSVQPLGIVDVPLQEALGSFLAEDVFADIDLPPFDNSAVDGYAVRAGDTRGASTALPVRLREIGEIAAGQIPGIAVTPGTACRIMTGAPIPVGADAVVMVEDTRREIMPSGGEVLVDIMEEAAAEQHVRWAGEDLRAGARVLGSGTRIRPAETAMLATMGRAVVRVARAPRVAVFSTGDELVDIAGGVPLGGKVRDSNRYTMAAMVQDAGARLCTVGHIADDPAATELALRMAGDPGAGADVILTAGGVSVGDRDYIKPAVERLGTLELWKVAIKPGKPLAFGRIGPTLFFGLPGNPISAMVTFELFVRPALKKLAGASRPDLFRRVVSATLMEAISHIVGRREYVRAITEWRDGRFESAVAGNQGSGMLHSATIANSLLAVPAESTGLSKGAIVEVMLLD